MPSISTAAVDRSGSNLDVFRQKLDRVAGRAGLG